MSTSVESIVNTLSEIESEIDRLYSSVEAMKKQLIVSADEQISFLREKLIDIAKKEAEKIVSSAKEEAQEESGKILKDCEKHLDKIRENIDSSLNNCIELVLQSLLSNK
jgi:V/A-type H+/Na+-transporting ATPase subunit G/H